MRYDSVQCSTIVRAIQTQFGVSVNCTVDAMNEAIKQLTEVQQKRMMLHFGNNLSYEEIAIKCGVSVAAMTTAMSRCLYKLCQLGKRDKLSNDDSIALLGLSYNIFTTLWNNDIKTCGDLINCDFNQLHSIKHIGYTEINAIKKKLREFDIDWEHGDIVVYSDKSDKEMVQLHCPTVDELIEELSKLPRSTRVSIHGDTDVNIKMSYDGSIIYLFGR